MDFGHALLVSALLLGLVEIVKRVIPAVAMNSRLIALTVLVCGQGAVFGLRYSVWANEQVIGGHPLDQLNFGSLVVAGLFLAIGATALMEIIVKPIKNIGENVPEKPIAK